MRLRPYYGNRLVGRPARRRFLFVDGGAERHQRQLGQFEALLTERDSQYGYAPDNSGKCEPDAKLQPAENYPDNVQYHMLAEVSVDGLAERPYD